PVSAPMGTRDRGGGELRRHKITVHGELRDRRHHGPDREETGRSGGAAHAASPPDELREQVEQTRAEPGETIQTLADKAAVKARTKEKTAEVKEQVVAKAGELKAKAAQAAHSVQDKLPDQVKDKAAQTAGQVREKTAQAGNVWEEKAPEPVRQQAAQGARMVRDNRKLLRAQRPSLGWRSIAGRARQPLSPYATPISDA
ncbi:DUF3618 domain-containing protein, partial [Streptomyces mirabilis]|uniref:DUF3618 domain-containing protein n=1 Tax=Streptomyces mirabilis TaxID=68239 RepID=UPI0036A28BCE